HVYACTLQSNIPTIMKKSVLALMAIISIIAGLYGGCHSNNNDSRYKDFLDLSARDTTVSPADNFFEYANGSWLKNTKIPEDKMGWGSGWIVQEKLNDRIKSILDSCVVLKDADKGSPARQIGNLYTSA